MSDVVGYRDQLLDYVYEQAGGSSTEIVPVLEFAGSVGLDLDGAYTLLWYCRDDGLVSDEASGMGHPCATLTSYGIADVLARRQRRADPAQRARACRAGLLRWLYAQHVAQAHLPAVEEFSVSDTALCEGVRFSPVEIEDASVYLSNKGLIEGTTVAERHGPTHGRITSDGIDCVTDWEGN
jgi:hypothetical protein